MTGQVLQLWLMYTTWPAEGTTWEWHLKSVFSRRLNHTVTVTAPVSLCVVYKTLSTVRSAADSSRSAIKLMHILDSFYLNNTCQSGIQRGCLGELFSGCLVTFFFWENLISDNCFTTGIHGGPNQSSIMKNISATLFPECELGDTKYWTCDRMIKWELRLLLWIFWCHEAWTVFVWHVYLKNDRSH